MKAKVRSVYRMGMIPMVVMALAGLAELSGQSILEGRDLGYVLRPMDVISIQIFGEADLEREQRIDGNGIVRLALVGSIQLAGLTLQAAEEQIEQAYVEGRYLRAPQAALTVVRYSEQFVSVLGQVADPGRIPLEDESSTIRLVDAISAVGGFTGIARGDAVTITRIGPEGEESVQVNAINLINGRGADVPERFQVLLPGDVVYVPERLF